MNQLPIFVTLRGRNVILLGDGEAADVKRRLIERAGGVVVGEDSADVVLAFVALEDETASLEATAWLKARGLLVNVVDRPELCDFTTPAIVDRDPVLIAIGTGGASAGLAKALRQRLEALLPAATGRLAKALFAARERLRDTWSDGAARRRAIDDAMLPGGPLDPLAGHAADAVEDWLAGADMAGETARVETILLTSDDPDDLTLRAARLLGQADRIYHDPDVPNAILNRARADAVRHAGPSPADPGPGLTVVLRRGFF